MNEYIPVVISTTRQVYYARIRLADVDAAARAIRNVRSQRRITGRWHTAGGVDELAITGPPPEANLTAITPLNHMLLDVLHIRACTPEAEAAWLR